MIRTGILALATTLAIVLPGALTPGAFAAGRWSSSKCIKAYTAFYNKHTETNGSVNAKQSKEIATYQRKLEKQHHCHFAG